MAKRRLTVLTEPVTTEIKCCECGESSLSVRMREDPFAVAVMDDDTHVPLCDWCTAERADNI